MRAPSRRYRPVAEPKGFAICRFGFDAPRLVEITSCDAHRRMHARDVLRGGALRIREPDVIARHDDLDAALAAFNALKAALPEIDGQVVKARNAYDRAVRQRLKAQAAIAAGKAATHAA